MFPLHDKLQELLLMDDDEKARGSVMLHEQEAHQEAQEPVQHRQALQRQITTSKLGSIQQDSAVQMAKTAVLATLGTPELGTRCDRVRDLHGFVHGCDFV